MAGFEDPDPHEGQFDDAEEGQVRESQDQGQAGPTTPEKISENPSQVKVEEEGLLNGVEFWREAPQEYPEEDEEDYDDEEDADDLWDDDWAEGEDGTSVVQPGKHPNRQPTQTAAKGAGGGAGGKVTKFQPAESVYKKFAAKINLEKYEGPSGVSGSAMNPVLEQGRRADRDRRRVKDKSDRATMEQVMDPRTRMILFKLLNRGFISEINGCISTGKEANVYHCTTKDGQDRAIKIYKTSILVFKDRDKYVTGEFRFRQGYGKKNPRKMVRTWAEKEMRNLIRLHNGGILCPEPILLRSHVLLMDFLGKDGWPSPRLRYNRVIPPQNATSSLNQKSNIFPFSETLTSARPRRASCTGTFV